MRFWGLAFKGFWVEFVEYQMKSIWHWVHTVSGEAKNNDKSKSLP